MGSVADSDRSAFEELFERYAGQVHGIVRKILHDPTRSEEVTHEVFLEIWRTADRFDAGRRSAGTWILTMAHRRAVDRIRAVRAADSVASVESVEAVEVPHDREGQADRGERTRPVADASEDVATHVAPHSERLRVRTALEQLTALQRTAVELAYYGGYTCREIAEQLGKPLETVTARVRDGIVRLRDALNVA